MAYKSIDANRQWGRAGVCLFLGTVLLLFGLILLFAPAIGAEDAAKDGGDPALADIGARLAGWISTFFFFGGTVQLFNFVRCVKARSVHKLTLADLGNDARAPILYLRPFTVDNAVMSSGARMFNPFNPFSWGKLRRWRGLTAGYGSYFKLRWTIEQVMEFTTREIGPLVAIGQPESPPVLGAYNLFVGDTWKEEVAGLAQRAQLVVLVAGATTPGLLWEVEFIRGQIDPAKFVIFVPGGQLRWWWPFWRKGSRKKHWAAFRQASAKIFPVPLPEKLGSTAFVGFGAGWKPFLLDPRKRPPVTQQREYLANRVMAII